MSQYFSIYVCNEAELQQELILTLIVDRCALYAGVISHFTIKLSTVFNHNTVT